MQATSSGPPLTTSYTPGYILMCGDCHNHYRAECVNRTIAGLPAYCPYCGSMDVRRSIDNDLDYWYSLAQSFGLKYTKEGADAIKELYDVWDMVHFSKFADFVKSIREGLNADKATTT